ncbi:MAG: 16S rRNA processing protein RimM [Clostridia bacterium]|nr:16S rRNA processing protein RimM [Clostridia bacterium]
MARQLFLEAGEVVGTHGVRGELRVRPECDSPEVIARLRTLYLDKNGTQPVRAKSRVHKNIALVKLAGIDTVEEASLLRGKMLYLHRKDVPLEKGQYFICDLIGLSVVDDTLGTVYGKCTDVTSTGSNDVYHLKTPDGKEVLIPAIPDIIRAVDIDNGVIRITPMLGLFDDEN